jgi:hypothetical protein
VTQLTIRVHSDLVRQGLENLADELPRIGRRRIRTMVDRVIRRMQEYPNERPGQTYKRTGRLFYSWTVESLDNGYRIGNDASRRGRDYAKYVVGDAYGTSQAWMHAGRWAKYRNVVEEEIMWLPHAVIEDINLVARRNNL